MKYKRNRKTCKWKQILCGLGCCMTTIWIYGFVKMLGISSPNRENLPSKEIQTNANTLSISLSNPKRVSNEKKILRNQTSNERILRTSLRKPPVKFIENTQNSNTRQEHSAHDTLSTSTPVIKKNSILRHFAERKKIKTPPPQPIPQSRTNRKTFRYERDLAATFVVDAFAFNGELDLLEMRLHELKHSVEAHIIVESAFDTYGNPKPLYYEKHKSRFSNFKHKIVYVKDTKGPAAKGCALGFRHLDAMRLMIVNPGFEMLPFEIMDHDILIITDADEIPSKYAVDMVRKANWETHDSFELFMRRSMFGFYWKMTGKQSQVANARKVGNHLAFIKLNEEMKKESTKEGFGNRVKQRVGRILRGGWHCSWCSSPKEILRKLENSLCGDGVRFGDFGYSLPLIERMQQEGIPFGAEERHPLGTTPTKVTRGHAPSYAIRHRSRYQYIMDPSSKASNDEEIQMPYCSCSLKMKQIVSTYSLAMKNQIQPMMKYWCKEEVQVCLNLTDADLQLSSRAF
jgi:hypothetical protein